MWIGGPISLGRDPSRRTPLPPAPSIRRLVCSGSPAQSAQSRNPCALANGTPAMRQSPARSQREPFVEAPMRLRAIGVFVVALSTTGSAQWLTQPTPGLPRTPDGKPNLKAPTPRIDGKPDFTGVWTGSEEVPRPASVDLQPWVNDAAHRHAQNFYKERPMFRCLPSGPATFSQSTGGGVWKRIVQTPTLIVILNDDLTFRQIFMDGRVLETDPFPSWMGYSVGRWEGDTLVVDSFGFNDKT